MLAVFQFDAVSRPLVQRLLADGRLPVLADLCARGQWLDLETPATHFPASSYFTLYSGNRVADHGLYHAFQWSPGEQRVRWRGEFPGPVAVWERVAAAGKRTLVIDPYESLPPGQLQGIAVSGWQFVNVMSLHRWSVPETADSELRQKFGTPRRLEEVFGRPTPHRLLALRTLLLHSTERVVDGALHLLSRDSYDLVWVSFLASHLGGHMFWNLSELDVDRLDDATRTTLEHALVDLYEQIDQSLGRVLAALPDDADIIVTSPLGMGENMIRVDLLPGMLEAVLAVNGADPGKRAESRAERFLWRLRGAVPVEVRARIAGALQGRLTRELTMRLSTLGVDWTKTPAFVLPSDHFGQIRLNIRGREREGIVEEGDADALVDQIREGLLSFRDRDGELSVASVDRTRDVVGEGNRVNFLPDVVVRWADRPSVGIDGVTSPQFGDVRRVGTGSGRSGSHMPEAWAVIVSSSSSAPHESPHVIDLAPTVCSALGVDPGDLPGSPLLVSR